MGRYPERLYRCPECLDTRWVENVERNKIQSVNPCRICAPAMYRRWKEGHLTGHICSCEECLGIRAGRINAYDYGPEGELYGGTLSGNRS